MKDWKHKLMIDNVANFFVEPENRIQSEVPYQWYGFKGYVDLVVRSIESNKVIEVKTDIVDFGATIRQHNRMKKYAIKALNLPRNSTAFLIFPLQKKIYNIIFDSINLLRGIVILFYYKDKGYDRMDRFIIHPKDVEWMNSWRGLNKKDKINHNNLFFESLNKKEYHFKKANQPALTDYIG